MRGHVKKDCKTHVSVNGRKYTVAEMTERIVKASRGHIDEKNVEKLVGDITPVKAPTKIVDKQGREIKLSSHQKNAIYKKARELKQQIREGMITHNQCWDPSDKNIELMEKREMPIKGKIEEYKRCMKAIKADPNDINTENLRRK